MESEVQVSKRELVRVHTSIKSTTGSVDEACSVRRTGGKELRARAKIPVWEKMEGVCVKTGLEKIDMK